MVMCQGLASSSGIRGSAASISEVGELGTCLGLLVLHVCSDGAYRGRGVSRERVANGQQTSSKVAAARSRFGMTKVIAVKKVDRQGKVGGRTVGELLVSRVGAYSRE